MKIEEFEQALEQDDFAVGDSFWLGDWEFQVVSNRNGTSLVCGNDIVFKWELGKDDFIQVIKDSHPEIKDVEGFFKMHKNEIVYYFGKGLNYLLRECGINYESVIRDALEEVMGGDKNEI